MKSAIAIGAMLAIAGSASANIRITEWMYNGNDGEFIEFTNLGASPIDLTGWSFDDDSATAGIVDLSSVGVLTPGASFILTEIDAATFRANWSLSASIPVVGGNAANLGRNDEINIFDAANNLVDRLSFGDQNFPGSIRTQNISGNPFTPAVIGTNNVSNWVFSTVGDSFGSRVGVNGDIANPGVYVPAPGAMALVGLAGLTASRRRR